jgi:hypothetical protein
LLTLLAEALDRSADAQRILDADGLLTTDRFGQQHAHPMVGVTLDAEVSAARLLRELDLDGESLPDPRMPRRR